MDQKNGIVIKGGTVVNDDGSRKADIFIKDGKIKKVDGNISPPKNCLVIDATNKLVIPGGVDPHTHFQFPFMGSVSIDDFYHGTLAALAGGTTMIMDFAIAQPGESLVETFNKWRGWADPKVCCDYALHVGVSKWTAETEAEMGRLAREMGVNSFKVFMAYKDALMLDDASICEVFRTCRELEALPMVHAENGSVIAANQKRLLHEGITGPEGHLQSRPEEVEAEAVRRAVLIAGQSQSPLYVVHVMSQSAAHEIASGRKKAVVIGETLASTLALDGRQYFDSCWEHAAGHVMSPPLNLDPTTPAHILERLKTGDLEVVASDHCTFKSEQKALGKKDFRKIPSGINGVEDRMSVTWQKLVHEGKMDPSKFVALTSTNAARIFNMYPKKGCLAVDSDADVVVWDPNAVRKISAKTHHHKVDFNVFEGTTCHGVATHVISRGKLVVEGDKIMVEEGSGKFVPIKPGSKYVYDRVRQLEKLRTFRKVERAGV